MKKNSKVQTAKQQAGEKQQPRSRQPATKNERQMERERRRMHECGEIGGVVGGRHRGPLQLPARRRP